MEWDRKKVGLHLAWGEGTARGTDLAMARGEGTARGTDLAMARGEGTARGTDLAMACDKAGLLSVTEKPTQEKESISPRMLSNVELPCFAENLREPKPLSRMLRALQLPTLIR
jgi:hypothetical protein